MIRRRTLGVAIGCVVAVLAAATGSRLYRIAIRPPASPAPLGWTARHVVVVRDRGDDRFELRADAAREERVRLGIFRIGVAHALRLDGVTLTLHLAAGGRPERVYEDVFRSLPRAEGSGGGLAALELRRFRLVLDGGAAGTLTIDGQRCASGFRGGSPRLGCRDGVRIAGVGPTLEVPALAFDLKARRFLGDATTVRSVEAAVARLTRGEAPACPSERGA